MSRPLLGLQSPAALEKMGSFHKEIVEEVSSLVAKEEVVVVGMGWNPVVKRARKNLEKVGQKYSYIGYGNYLSGWRKRLAIKLWSGWPTFPQVFVRGTLIGGNAELEVLLKEGRLLQAGTA
jgi:glutaredoxin-related protein